MRDTGSINYFMKIKADQLLRHSEIVVGGLLLYSGVRHAINPYYFITSVAEYKLLPIALLWFVPFALANLMILIGCCFIANQCIETARYLGAVLFLVFAVAQSVSWSLGMQISCGCFGHSIEPISLRSISIPVVCFVVCSTSALLTRKSENT